MPNFLRTLAISCLFLLIGSSTCLGQIRFSDIVESSIDARSKIHAYSFDYMMMSRRVEKKDANSQTVLITFEEGSIAGLPRKNLWYTKRRDQILDYNGKLPTGKENSLQEFSPLKGREVHTIHRGGVSYSVVRGSMDPKPKVRQSEKELSHPSEPFDYRYFGLATAGDIFVGEQYPKICSNYRSFAETNSEIEMLSGELEGSANVKIGPHELIFALDKEYWVTESKMTLSKRVLGEWVENVVSRTELEVVRKYDHWWPKYVNVRGKNISMEIFFDWHDPKKINEAVFDLGGLREIAMAKEDGKMSSNLSEDFQRKRASENK